MQDATRVKFDCRILGDSSGRSAHDTCTYCSQTSASHATGNLFSSNWHGNVSCGSQVPGASIGDVRNGFDASLSCL